MKRFWRYVASSVIIAGISATSGHAQQTVAVEKANRPRSAAVDQLLSRPISIDLEQVTLKEAVDSVAALGGVEVQYRSTVVSGQRTPISVHVTNTPLGIVFDRVLRGTGLQMVPLKGVRFSLEPAGDRLAAFAGIIAGKVTDAKTQQPLRGVSVTLDDTVGVVRTDDSGVFRFTTVAAGSHRLSVRSIRYTKQTRLVTVVDGQSVTADFTLETNVTTLDQVVVTATGEQRIRELGHVVARLNVDSLVHDAPITDVREVLQSRIPGLQVINGDGGVAGADMTLRLRGNSTFSLDAQPIVIVDGVRYRSNNVIATGDVPQNDSRGQGDLHSPLNDLNPNDIETLEVVKGPSASTLYGPDAANGVIVITTKHGKVGKPEFRWYFRPTTNDESNTPMTDALRVFAHQPDGSVYADNGCTLVNQYKYHYCVVDSIRVVPSITADDRYSVIAKSRPGRQYGASVGGGSTSLRYFLSSGVTSQTGILQLPPLAQQYLKQQLGTSSLSDALRNPNNLRSITTHASLGTDINEQSSASVVVNYTNTDHRRADAGEFANQYLRGATAPGQDTTSIFSFLDPTYALTNTQDTDNRFTGAASGTYRLLPWLSANGTAGIDLGIATTHTFRPGIFGGSASATDDRRETTDRTLTAGVTATRDGVVSFRTSLGTQYEYSHLDGTVGAGYGLAPGSSTTNTAASQSFNQLWTEQVNLGTYAEEVVGLKNRLFVTGSLRYDGSTSFGEAYDPKPYPKVGLSWIVSDEPVLRSVPAFTTIVGELRLRASYGAASRYPTTTMKIGDYESYASTLNGRSASVIYRDLLANPVLRPELSREREFGFDATLIGNIGVQFTWYHKRILDQLLRLDADLMGMAPYWANTASSVSYGHEVTVQIPLVDRRLLRANLGVAYSFNNSRVTSLRSVHENRNSFGSGFAVGYPIGAVFGRPIIGVSDSATARGIVFPEDVIHDSVRFLGVLVPPRTFTVTPSVQLLDGRVRMSALFDRQTDFVRLSYGCSNALCIEPYLTSTPLLVQAQFVDGGGNQFEPGDFTRWREFTVTVDAPVELTNKLHLGRASVGLQGRNLALWTSQQYKGPDPESFSKVFGNATSRSTGIPQARAWSLRFDITP